MSGFYVYLWSSPADGLLYIGKGKSTRAGSHLRSKDWAQKKALKCEVKACASEAEALLWESFLIQFYGKGQLRNAATPRACRPLVDIGGLVDDPDSLLEDILDNYGVPNRFREVEQLLDAIAEIQGALPDHLNTCEAVEEYLTKLSGKYGREHAVFASLAVTAAAPASIWEDAVEAANAWRWGRD